MNYDKTLEFLDKEINNRFNKIVDLQDLFLSKRKYLVISNILEEINILDDLVVMVKNTQRYSTIIIDEEFNNSNTEKQWKKLIKLLKNYKSNNNKNFFCYSIPNKKENK